LDAPLLSADDFFKGTNPAPAASPAVASNHGEVGLADTAAPFAPPTANLAEDGTAALGPAAAATKPVAEARMPGAPRQEQSPNRLKTAAARKQAGGQPPSAMVESYGFSRDVTDRYDIQGEIGAGGMGEVYKAEDKMLGRIVALKFLTANMADNPMALKFFMREARSVAALNHPAIVTIFDIGVLDQRPFICMEFVEGTDLGSRLEDQGPIEVGHAVNLVIQVALALDYAHQQKVVHRDIKPSNILQARGGQVKILDFGLAKVIQGGPKTSTIVAGTPAYMAPEQLAGRDVDGRADLFSLGVLLYEVLTNHLPFDGMLRTETIAPATSTAPWLPAALDPLISRAVALDVDRRFANCKEFATALGQVARSLQATG
jgi:serine/threonine protein kinase